MYPAKVAPTHDLNICISVILCNFRVLTTSNKSKFKFVYFLKPKATRFVGQKIKL